MPRRAFIADLQRAKDNILPRNTFDLRDGDEDGTFVFLFAPPAYPAVTIQAHVSDVGHYPKAHTYFVYTTSEAVPPGINDALSDPSVFDRLEIFPMIEKTSALLERTLSNSANGMGNVQTLGYDEMDIDSELQDPDEESDDGSWANDFDDDDDDDNFDGAPSVRINENRPNGSSSKQSALVSDPAFNSRIRQDLRAVKRAGFRLACYGQLFDHGKDCYVIVSCRVAKLNIPEDTLRAWYLEPTDYILLVMHYFDGYQTNEGLQASAKQRKPLVRMHVGVSKKYKVPLSEALSVFAARDSRSRVQDDPHKPNLEPKGASDSKLRALFIGGPLNELLNERIVSFINRRLTLGCSWRGAEEYHQNLLDRARSDVAVEIEWSEPESGQSDDNLPAIVKNDHLQNDFLAANHSFPVVAMQYALRRVIQCTEYCLVCHRKTDADFEALKPYVCSRPLCLYQYMALGFGPSLEHEILTQPHVVDLLVSFCYYSTSCYALAHPPQGMGLTVPINIGAAVVPPMPLNIAPPVVVNPGTTQGMPGSQAKKPKNKAPTPPPKPIESKQGCFEARFDEIMSELIFPLEVARLDFDKRPVRPSDWVMVDRDGDREHRRVIEVFYPNVRLGPPVIQPVPVLPEPNPTAWPTKPRLSKSAQGNASSSKTLPDRAITGLTDESQRLRSVKVYPYNQNFDDMAHIQQQQIMSTLLGTLPSVTEMKSYLENGRSGHTYLRSWVDRVSPAALGLLRWIVASNRSCIIQIDSLDSNVPRVEDRVSGMKGYMQFRFAQGAPDKEQRFITSVRETASRLKPKQETLFAWHGSPLKNWHGIIREGLHYNVAAHGRAYGDGVYHALQAHVSEGYSHMSLHRFGAGYNQQLDYVWPASELGISTALCLNEVVNAPSEFQSSQPYLVVKQLDWIQTRYLFVKCHTNVDGLETEKPSQSLELDPKYPLLGNAANELVMIPVTAVSKTRRPASRSGSQGNKKIKTMAIDLTGSRETDKHFSDASDEEDLRMLESDSEEARTILSRATNILRSATSLFHAQTSTPKTDFKAGTLDKSSLPLLAPPMYATTPATRALQRELKSTLKVQETTPLHELGWYIDPEFDNMYQWIVELHSFDPALPLAKDMKSKGLTSIVLELRFGSEYPYSPPFVRVIKPRFLSFLQGGGGHVTAGGALCMELLTNNGWNPASSIEAVLLQVRMAMTSTDPKPARLETHRQGAMGEYTVWEAIEAYKRACAQHGWTVPKDFKEFEGPSSVPQSLQTPSSSTGRAGY